MDSSATLDSFRLLPGVPCKTCSKAIFDPIEMEWRTCNDCAAVCDHQYIEGVGTVNGHIAHMTFCNLCGRADPEWQPNENPVVDVLNTVASGDLAALVLEHSDGSTISITKQ